MKNILASFDHRCLGILLVALLLALLGSPWANATDSVPYVIFEDDFDSDSDGPTALCMLLELEAAGECKIIACGTSELHEDSTSTMAATLHYFGRGDIPLGSLREDLWPYDPANTQLYDQSRFNTFMAADTFNYGHTRKHRREYPDAVEVYANALKALPPGAKAKIIVVGGQTNLRTFLEQHPQLVRDRVSELHFFGGRSPATEPETKWQTDSNISNTDPNGTAGWYERTYGSCGTSNRGMEITSGLSH